MNGNSAGWSSRWLVALCWLQVVGATAAALAALVDVESIVGFCPAIALLGFVLALLSIRHSSLNLLLFGLLCPVTTGMIALLIASFSLSPGQAEIPVSVILMVNAGVIFVWGALTNRRTTQSRSSGPSADNLRFRFSLLRILGLVTLTCILLALFRQITGSGEMRWFAVYGISILVLSLAVSMLFWYRVKRSVSEGDDAQTTVKYEGNVGRPTRHGRSADAPSA